MGKKLKVFSKKMSKNDSRKDMTDSQVNTIFGNVTEADAQYIHTSHWDKENKEPIHIGKWENFEIKNGEVFAELSLNEKGLMYESDGVFKGISAEIDGLNNSLINICVLPLGVASACVGTEFEEKNAYNTILEYEIIKEGGNIVTIEEIKQAMLGLTLENKLELMQAIAQSVTADQKKQMRNVVYGEFEEKITPEQQKVIDDLAAKDKVIQQYEADAKKSKVDAVMKEQKTKLVGELPEILEYALTKAVEETEIQEFEAGVKQTRFERIVSKIEKMKDFKYLTEEFEGKKDNKEKTEIQKTEEIIKNTMDSIKKRQGVK